MKKLLLSISFMALGTMTLAQTADDSISVGTGYANQSFYSLDSGEVANTDNSNWDIAFDVSGFGSTIRINGAIGTELYKYPNGDTSAWSTLDTSGFSSWLPVYDSDTSWSGGAFNSGRTSNQTDLGWGVYNTITHHVVGDSLFVIKLVDGTLKKLQIQSLASGKFYFKYADLDGTNEVNEILAKSSFVNKNFGYYNLRTGMSVDREPLNTSWDLVFTKYVAELFPGTYYGVTGVLQNNDVEVIEMHGINDVYNYTSYAGHTFGTAINTIGYDWKSFNGSNWTYDIIDSLCYFVDDVQGNVWRLILTNFGGSATGDIHFHKELISAVSIEEVESFNIGLYPNPANSIAHIVFKNKNQSNLVITNLQGQRVFEDNIIGEGLTDYVLELYEFQSGIYFINIQQGDQNQVERLIVK